MIHIITILQTLIFFGYVAFIYRRYGVIGSISTSSYELQGQERWYFMGFLWAIALLNLGQGLGIWGVVSSAGLIFSGITIEHRKFGGRQFHYVGTVIGVVAAIVALVVIHGMYLPIVFALLAIIISTRFKYVVWWAEIFLFIVIIFFYFMR